MKKLSALSALLVAFTLVSTGCPGGGNGGGAACTIGSPLATQQATYYTTSAPAGACGIPFSGLPAGSYMAVNPAFFAGSAGCGTCYLVSGPEGSIIARVVDSCPDCAADSAFDLSPEGFVQVAGGLGVGRVTVTYTQVPCNVSGNLKLQFEGSNPYYIKLRVLNSENPIESIEIRNGNSWLAMTRTVDNAFQVSPGFEMPAPYAFRITDVFGQVITQGAAMIDNTTPVEGSDQLPACDE